MPTVIPLAQMPKPSVARAINSTVLPSLTAIGFQRFSGKKYVRVRDDICQFLFLHVESRIKREFMLEFCAMLICQPHDFECLDPGGRFPDGNGRWYPAHNDDRLAESVGLISDQLPQTLIPWYERSISIQGFIETYTAYAERNGHLARNGHSQFTLACAQAKHNNSAVAVTHAKQGIADYEAIYEERPVCEWAKDGAAQCRQLLDALTESSADKLLAEWRSHTIKSLKLEPVIHAENEG